MGEKTTIQVTKKTRDALKAIGKKDESYEIIILGLLKKGEQEKG